MIKLEVNEKGDATVKLEGKMEDILTNLTKVLVKVIKEDKRCASAVRIALLLTGEREMSTAEKLALLETIIERKADEKK